MWRRKSDLTSQNLTDEILFKHFLLSGIPSWSCETNQYQGQIYGNHPENQTAPDKHWVTLCQPVDTGEIFIFLLQLQQLPSSFARFRIIPDSHGSRQSALRASRLFFERGTDVSHLYRLVNHNWKLSIFTFMFPFSEK